MECISISLSTATTSFDGDESRLTRILGRRFNRVVKAMKEKDENEQIVEEMRATANSPESTPDIGVGMTTPKTESARTTKRRVPNG
jgi:hypothetical protein